MSTAYGGQVRPVTSEQFELVQAWISLALEQMPFMASMLFSLRFADAPGLGTFAVDAAHRCYVDFEAVAPKGAVYCGQALLHECSHLFAEHHQLAQDLGVEPSSFAVWGVAADAAINDDLRDGGCEMFDDGNPYGHVLPVGLGEPDHRTPHHYFRSLQERIAAAREVGDGVDPGATSDGGSSPEDGPSGPAAWSGCGSGSGGAAAPCELGEDDDLNGTAVPVSSAERGRARVATAASIRSAAASGRGRGSVPAGLVEVAELVLAPPKVQWQQVLGRMLRGAVRSQAGVAVESYQRRSVRRHDARLLTKAGFGSRLVLPGQCDPVPRIHVVRDTSGSMSEADLGAVTSEIVGIARRLRVRGEDLVISDADAEVHSTRRYGRASALSEVTGRGGTDMRVGIDRALESRPRPSAVVVMTDGGTPWPQKQSSRVPVIAAIVTDTPDRASDGVPGWIRTVPIPKEGP